LWSVIEHADAARTQEADDALDLQHRDRVDAGEGLVQQDEARLGGQRARDLHAPPLAAGQRRGRRVGELLDAQLAQQLAQQRVDARLGQRSPVGVALQLQHGADVLLHIELAEDRGLLRQVRQPQARALVDGQVLHRPAVDGNRARIGAHQAHHHVERGGLARAVGPEQAHHLASVHRQVHVAHHLPRAVALLQPAGSQQARAPGCHRAGSPRPREGFRGAGAGVPGAARPAGAAGVAAEAAREGAR
jgi:hypothetical protein